jgi:hypothetical protein
VRGGDGEHNPPRPVGGEPLGTSFLFDPCWGLRTRSISLGPWGGAEANHPVRHRDRVRRFRRFLSGSVREGWTSSWSRYTGKSEGKMHELHLMGQVVKAVERCSARPKGSRRSRLRVSALSHLLSHDRSWLQSAFEIASLGTTAERPPWTL